MLRSPLVMAALADAALPRLLPASVASVPTRITDRFQEALVEGEDGTQWIVRLSRNAAAGAAAELADTFVRLLAKRVEFGVPVAEGRMTIADRNTVTVHRSFAGAPMQWRGLTGGSRQSVNVAKALAQLHDVDPRIADEVGVPSYDSDAYRTRRLATLDRAAATGLVPSGLLTRWERALEEVSLWRFPTCLTHGPLEGHHVYGGDEVSGIGAWENACVADPADDFAALWAAAPAEAFDTILETYSAARHEAPDKHLERRVRLSSELLRVTALLDAVGVDDDRIIDRRAAALRRLNEQTVGDDSLMPQPPRAAPVVGAQPADEPGQLAADDADDIDLAEPSERDAAVEADERIHEEFDDVDDTDDAEHSSSEAHLREDDTIEIDVSRRQQD
ncbi:phosphotransferase [Yimella sp. cx-51]|uniref:phosphotransferase n=1 Tax=Yimella sp. cx-51 TaxID=2770551 RepID=UPI00165E3926|nr:phosphotransferase [Yimella sp. cx-51]MBC9956068.1 phosphotransferase [Yimella sp. cx-51]QTH37400.1 phosphotransferase [Yimella sp. cx-51]